MSDKTALGDRIKAYEAITRAVLPPRTYAVIRCDIRAAHSYLKDARRPFDDAFVWAMDETAKALCEGISGAVLAFVQSDEISVLMTHFETVHTQPWFGGVVAKIVSVSAGSQGRLSVMSEPSPGALTGHHCLRHWPLQRLQRLRYELGTVPDA